MTIRAAYSAPEVAERWGVHPETIYRMVREGKLPRIPHLGKVRIPIDAVEEAERCGSSYTGASGPSSGPRTASQGAAASERPTATKPTAGSEIASASYLDSITLDQTR